MIIERKSILSGKTSSMDLPITQLQYDLWREWYANTRSYA